MFNFVFVFNFSSFCRQTYLFYSEFFSSSIFSTSLSAVPNLVDVTVPRPSLPTSTFPTMSAFFRRNSDSRTVSWTKHPMSASRYTLSLQTFSSLLSLSVRCCRNLVILYSSTGDDNSSCSLVPTMTVASTTIKALWHCSQALNSFHPGKKYIEHLQNPHHPREYSMLVNPSFVYFPGGPVLSISSTLCSTILVVFLFSLSVSSKYLPRHFTGLS